MYQAHLRIFNGLHSFADRSFETERSVDDACAQVCQMGLAGLYSGPSTLSSR